MISHILYFVIVTKIKMLSIITITYVRMLYLSIYIIIYSIQRNFVQIISDIKIRRNII